LRQFTVPLGLSGIEDPAGLALLLVAFGLSGLITMPLTNAYSRWREGLADDFALDNIDHPQAFATAMIRLANQNLAEADPERWIVLLLHSHPPLSKRIANAQNYQAQN
jgi:STE24 endopeptidase